VPREHEAGDSREEVCRRHGDLECDYLQVEIAGYFMAFAAFLMQSEPPALTMLEVVAGVIHHSDKGKPVYLARLRPMLRQGWCAALDGLSRGLLR
jgi:hypothetical protein